MKKLVIYLHGKGGNAEEAEHFKPLFPDCDVIGFDYRSQYPWEAKTEFPAFIDSFQENYDSVFLLANSIGAYFALSSLSEQNIKKAWFISPIVDMEKLIQDMLLWAQVNEQDLEQQGEIRTSFQETLSWKYLCYVREHPLRWQIPTSVLYGEKDNLTSYATIQHFCEQTKADLTLMQNGEHWFHTDDQLAFLDAWLQKQQ